MPLALVLTFGAVISAQPIPQAPGAEAAVREVRPAHPMRDFKGDPAYPDSYWGTATPGEARIDTAGLDAAVARIAEKGWEIHGMVVARNGKIVFERYGWKTGQNADDPDKSQHQVLPNERHLMHSTTKSITSALVGIALHEGLIPGGIEARAVSFFPEWQPLPDASPEKDSIRIVDLLTMRSGLRYQEGTDDQAIFFEPQSPAHAYLSRPVVGRPVGTKWNYSSAGSGVLAAILKKVTGKSPKRYAEEKLFTPLGIADPPWAAGKDGIQHGGWGLELTTREMARFGELYRLEGKWNGRQVVPAEWVAESTKAHSETPWNGQYGYQWWLPKRLPECFATRGAYGQDTYVCPKLGLVVAFTSDMKISAADANLDGLMAEIILPAVKP
jgi:CubicO group peptidase (beta-lactamase class C family)